MKDRNCGPGKISQIRNCTDGTFETCTLGDRQRNVSCQAAGIKQLDCERLLGNWTNIGNCSAVGVNKTCGPGIIKRVRECQAGTIDKCEDVGLSDTINCKDVGIALPPCEKKLGNWTTNEACKSIVDGCGPRFTTQIRECTDGTNDKCTKADTERTVTCDGIEFQQPNCTGNIRSRLHLYKTTNLI